MRNNNRARAPYRRSFTSVLNRAAVEAMETRRLLSAGPFVESINRLDPRNSVTGASQLKYTVTFNENVTGVDPTDFKVVTSAGATASQSVIVTPLSESVYDVTINGIVGPGSVRLDLVNNRSIRDLSGSTLIGTNDTVAFAPPISIPTGGGLPVAVGDFNNDGNLDFVEETANGDTADVYLGDGHGGFGSAIALQSAVPFQFIPSIAVADLNGDGNLDLVLDEGNQLAVFAGLGNGHFAASINVPTGGGSSQVVVGDFNGDKLPDVATANYTNGTVTVAFGNRTNLVSTPDTVPAGVHPSAIGVGDLNGDGNLDLVVSEASNFVRVLTGDGHGKFVPGATPSIEAPAQDLLIADVNGDGKQDIIASVVPSLSPSNPVDVVPGNGDGTFGSFVSSQIVQTDSPLVTADLNGDGLPDLILANGGGFWLLTNVGGDQFVQKQSVLNAVLADGIGVGDFNNDGIPDLLLTSDQSDAASLLLGQGASFQGQTYTILPPVHVDSINRLLSSTQTTSANALTYQVQFSTNVKGVDASDFKVVTSGVVAAGPIQVTQLSDSTYDVTVTGVHGNGSVQLDLIDNNTISDISGNPLGTGQPFAGSFDGQTYSIVQTLPRVVGINRESPLAPAIGDEPVTYQVLFNEPVTGVDVSDFQVLPTGNVTYSNPLVVKGSGQVWTVTINGVQGGGSVTLKLVDNGSIHDLNGNRLAEANGDLALDAAVVDPTTQAQLQVAIADMNGDGIPDRVAVSSTTISVELGKGDGTFGPAIQTEAPGNLQKFAIGDFNGDGIPDIVASAILPTSQLWVYDGVGDGSFYTPTPADSGGANVSELQTGDLNGDGKTDLIVGFATSPDIIYPGTGNLSLPFGQGIPINAGTSLNIVDINGDHFSDIVGTNGVFVNDGHGTFSSVTPAFTQQLAKVGDFNGDGKLDVLAISSNEYQIWLGDGAGNFTAQPLHTEPGIVKTLTEVEVADVNNDGVSDIAFTSAGSFYHDTTVDAGTIQVSFGIGDGTFSSPTSYEIGQLSGNFVLADVNADSQPDLTVALATGLATQINSKGNLGAAVTFAPHFQSKYATIATADFNGDGRPDLVVAGFEESIIDGYDFREAIDVYLANADGSYTESFNEIGGIDAITSISVADLNGDGIPDVIATEGDSNTLIYLGNSAGQLIPVTQSVTIPTTGSVAVADFNGDGRPDLVSSDGVQALFFVGNGDGTFQAGVGIPGTAGPSDATAADINNDGNVDVVLAGNGLQVLLVNGDGTFESPRLVATSSSRTGTLKAAVADMNNDGLSDLVIADSGQPDHASIYLQNADGSFSSSGDFYVGNTQSIAVGDLNGDGIPDIVTSRDATYISFGRADGTLTPPSVVAPSGAVTIADVNGDGIADIIFAHTGYLGGGGDTDANSSGTGTIFGIASGDLIGDTYNIVQTSDFIAGSSANDAITLTQDPDHQHIDWQMGFTYGQLPIDDPNGLTIFGDGGIDSIYLNYAYGDPLPLKISLNGQFILNNLQTTDNLAGRQMDIGASRIWISYNNPAADPIDALRSYLHTGYNSGLWNGRATTVGGAIVASIAANDPSGNMGIGFVDSASGLIAGQPANTVFLHVAAYGDTAINNTVGFNDFTRLTQHYGTTRATWAQGDFNYDGLVNFADFTLLSQNYQQPPAPTAKQSRISHARLEAAIFASSEARVTSTIANNSSSSDNSAHLHLNYKTSSAAIKAVAAYRPKRRR